MSFFEVQPEVLRQQSELILVEQNTLGAVASAIGLLRESASAAGTPEAVHALDRFAIVVSTRVDLMREAVDGIGVATGESGASYTAIDLGIAENIRNVGEQLAGAD